MKKSVLFLLLSVLILSLTWVFAVETISADLNENIVRLHILANSDSPADQALKLAVRDRILAEAEGKPETLTDEEIHRICADEIVAQGFSYDVTVLRGRFHFPQKRYDNLSLPEGDYRAVRIIIGEGAGQNWWCVMYPPLCFAADAQGLSAEGQQKLKNTLMPESYAMICESDSIVIKPSFKLFELWQKLKGH